MRALIDDLLAYSRLAREELRLQEVDTDGLVGSVTEDLARAIAETGAEVRRTNLPVINADPGGLRTVFQNLISNALKFKGDDPPVVEVSAERLDGVWQFSVADNGIGISPTTPSASSGCSSASTRARSTRARGSGWRWCSARWSARAARVAVEPSEGGNRLSVHHSRSELMWCHIGAYWFGLFTLPRGSG